MVRKVYKWFLLKKDRKKMIKCRICDNLSFNKLLKYNLAPRNIQRLLTKEELVNDKRVSFNLVQCDKCGLVQIDDTSVVSESYYENYFMTTAFSKCLKKYEKELCNKFVSKFNLKGKRLFEIGSGEGQFLSLFKKQNIEVIGIEPSEAFLKVARDKGLNMLKEYFDENTSLEKESYDAFVSRQVFEHLNEPNKVLRGVKKVLKEGGVGMIEVPSFEKSIINKRYYDVFLDHPCYYTKKTLLYLLNKNGFEVIDIFSSFNGEYMVAFFRKESSFSLEKFIKDFKEYKSDFTKELKKITSKSRKVIMFGAGGKGIALLNLCGVSDSQIKYIIDSDKFKQGKYTLGTHHFINNPEILFKDTDVDAIIISAMAYYNEIKKQLREKYKFKGSIYRISPKLEEI